MQLLYSITATLVVGRTYHLINKSVSLHQTLWLTVRLEQEERVTPMVIKTVK